MGVEETVSATRFPRQGAYLGQEVLVCFHYDTSQQVRGRVIRDDAEAPGRMVILLQDERVVLSTECQWKPVRAAQESARG